LLLILALSAGVQRAQAAPVRQTDADTIRAELAAITATDPTFADDFSSWDEQWTLGSDGGMSNHDGSLEAVAVQGLGDGMGWITHDGLAALDLTDYLAAVTVTHAPVAAGEFVAGLLFRYTDAANFYAFVLQGEAAGLGYSLLRMEAGREAELVTAPLALAAPRDAATATRLGVLVVGDAITLLINDEVVDTVTDATHAGGSIGLGSAARAGAEAGITFDDVALWTLVETPELVATTTPAPEEEEPVIAATATATPTAAVLTTAADLTAQLETVRANDPDDYDEFRRATADWSGATTDLVTVTLAAEMRQLTIQPGGFLYDLRSALVDAAPTAYLAEIDTSFGAGDAQGQYGLLFRYVDDNNFYLFALEDDSYTLWRKVAGTWATLAETQAVDALVPRGDNRLGVLVQAETIVLLINDSIVDQLQDDAIAAGGVGLYAEAIDDSDEAAVVAFDNFEFWQLDAPLALPATAPVTTPLTSTATTALDAIAISAQVAAIHATASDYYDEFRRDTGDWLGDDRDTVLMTTVDRTRHIAIEPDERTVDLYAPSLELAPTDSLVEVDIAEQFGEGNHQAGLAFRYQDAQNYYYFGIGDSIYSLWVQAAGEWTNLIDWTATTALVEAGENRIGVLLQGSTITLLINNTPVNQITDATLPQGGVGLYVQSATDIGAEIVFDNFDWWLLTATAATEISADPPLTATLLADATTLVDAATVQAQIDALQANPSDYYDDFGRASELWSAASGAGVTVDYQQRMRYITIDPERLVVDVRTDLVELAPVNYLVEVDAQAEIDPGAAQYGLVFRYQDKDNLYFFGLSGDSYGLWLKLDGTWQQLIAWTPADAIVAGAVNRLGVLVDGTQVNLLVNGEVVDRLRSDAIAAGAAGLSVEASAAGPATIAFDNFDLWLSAATTTTSTAESTLITPTLQPGPAVTEVASQIGELRELTPFYSTTFTADSGDWSTVVADDRTIAVTDQTLAIDVASTGQLAFSRYQPAAELTASDYYVEVAASTEDSERDGSYGVLFRVLDEQNFYLFEVLQDRYGLRKLQNGEWSTLIDWTSSEYLDLTPGAVHRLGVWVAGPNIGLLIDDWVVATLLEESLPTGGVALGAGTFGAETFSATFDDLQLWRLAFDAATNQITIAEQTTNTTTPSAFELYADKLFSLDHPVDWAVTLEENGITVKSTVDDSGLMIFTLYTPEPVDTATMDRILVALAEKGGGDVTWGAPTTWGENGRRIIGAAVEGDMYVGGTWVNSPAGAAIYLYAMGVAQGNSTAELAPIFAQILDSLTITGTVAPTQTGAEMPHFEAWTETDTGAFTLDVPTGWAIKGGVYAASTLDQRQWLTAVSPDESIWVTIGDNRIPSFIVPNALLRAQGYSEQDSYLVGDTEFTILPYLPGEAFLEEYAATFLDLSDCDVDLVPLPDLSAAIQAYVKQNGIDWLGVQQDAGALTYICGTGDEEYVGYLLALTALHEVQDAELWGVSAFYSIETWPDDLPAAMTILQAMMSSYVIDPQWAAQQLGLTTRVAAEQSQTAIEVAQLLAEGVAAEQIALFGGIDTSAMTPYLTIESPETGEEQSIFADPNVGWIDSAGNILGTDVPALPDQLDVAGALAAVE